MVMDAGRVAEFDSPEALLAKKDSVFAGMAREAGLVALQEEGNVYIPISLFMFFFGKANKVHFLLGSDATRGRGQGSSGGRGRKGGAERS